MLSRFLALVAVLMLACASTDAHAYASPLQPENARQGVSAVDHNRTKEIAELSADGAKENSASAYDCASRQTLGEQFDPNLGFYNLRARWMDPRTGRFVGLDTFDGSSFDPPGLHKYLYANVDPVNGRDPTGHATLVEIGVTLNTLSITINVATYAVNIATGNVVGLAENVVVDAAAMLVPGGALANGARRLGALFVRGTAGAFKWGVAHSSKILRFNMELFGALPRMCGSCAAHHIIPGGEKFIEAILARDLLKKHGIDINSFVNGAWLDRAVHYKRHFQEYSKYVYEKIREYESAGGKQGVYDALKQLREELMAGELDHLL